MWLVCFPCGGRFVADEQLMTCSASESDPGSGFVTPGDTVGIARPGDCFASFLFYD